MYTKRELAVLDTINKVYSTLSEESKNLVSINVYREKTISLFKNDGSWILCLFEDRYELTRTANILEGLKDLVENVEFNCRNDVNFKTFKSLIYELYNKDLEEKYSTTTTYIDWLEYFTKSNSYFCSTDSNYDEKTIGKSNSDMVKNLKIFFEIIKSYASKNYISSILSAEGESYKVSYNENVYEIGLNAENVDMYWVKKIQNSEFSIPYDYIIEGKSFLDNQVITQRLTELKNYIKTLVNNNVSISEIEEIFTEVKQEKVKLLTNR